MKAKSPWKQTVQKNMNPINIMKEVDRLPASLRTKPEGQENFRKQWRKSSCLGRNCSLQVSRQS